MNSDTRPSSSDTLTLQPLRPGELASAVEPHLSWLERWPVEGDAPDRSTLSRWLKRSAQDPMTPLAAGFSWEIVATVPSAGYAQLPKSLPRPQGTFI
jgi:hypothetical protein